VFRLTSLLGFFLLSIGVMAQEKYKMSGKITDGINGEPLIGAAVTYAEGKGTVTDFDGNFSLELEKGVYTLTVSYVGFEKSEQKVDLTSGPKTVDFSLKSVTMKEVQVVANVAVDRETPVAFTNITPKKIQEELGTQDLPMLLNTTPGVYATQQGGGDGDTRINIRGFNQRNIGVMIDGVPVNDMENGWVYWSNWFGLDAVTRNVQVQRGLGAAKTAIPSVGGTMNIITNGIDQKRFLTVKQDYTFGEGVFYDEDEKHEDLSQESYLRTTVGFNSGKLKGDWGFTLAGAFKTGNSGATFSPTLGGFYYAKIEKRIKSHIISVSAFGAPQEHGQRSFKLQIEDYSKEVAQRMGVDTTGAYDYGLAYNKYWGYLNRFTVNESGDTIYEGEKRVSTQKNYYHKPQFTLKHSWSINEKLFWSTTAYASLGFGGGVGSSSGFPLDAVSGQYNMQAAYNANYASSISPVGQRLYSSKNEHQWYGAVSTVNYDFHKRFSFAGGLDYRYYHGLHYREAYDLLGGDSLLNTADQNTRQRFWYEGDVIDYNNDSYIHWGGGFAQLEYKSPLLSAFVNVSSAVSAYNRVDYFRKKDLVLSDTTFTQSLSWMDTIVFNGQTYHNNSPEARHAQSGWVVIPGYTVKAGVNVNLNPKHNIFVNGGYISRAQRFANVIDNSNRVLKAVENEEVMAVELGYSGRYRFISYNINGYYTRWNNRPLDQIPSRQGNDGTEIGLMSGISANHLGIEIDVFAQPLKWLEVDGMFSIGDWRWDSDGSVRWYTENGDEVVNQNGSQATTYYNARGVHVGDAAQTQASLAVKFRPIKGLFAQVRWNHFSRYYAQFEPTDLDGSTDFINEDGSSKDSWKLPAYNLFDLNMGYSFKWAKKLNSSVRFGVRNLFNLKYISDADNNGAGTNTFDAESATVFFGTLRTYNISFSITL
jgi:hypothetical protein